MEAFKKTKNRLKQKKRDFWRDAALEDDHRKMKRVKNSVIGQFDGERENIKEPKHRWGSESMHVNERESCVTYHRRWWLNRGD